MCPMKEAQGPCRAPGTAPAFESGHVWIPMSGRTLRLPAQLPHPLNWGHGSDPGGGQTTFSIESLPDSAHPGALRGPCQRQTSWVTPIQKGPLLQTLISCACQVPSTSSPLLSHPPQSSRRSAAPRPPGVPVAGPSWGWRTIYPFSPLFYTSAVQGPCSNLTGKLRHATPRRV